MAGFTKIVASGGEAYDEWIVFSLGQADYGKFWQDDPYTLVQKLGWSFNTAVGLHIDAWPQSADAEGNNDDDSWQFMMPVKRPRPG